MFTKNFKQLTKNDVDIAGGKGASLGEMTRSKIPVPPGFVTLSNGFDRFLDETGLTQKINAQLHKVNYNDAESVNIASKVIRGLIHDAPMPEDLAKEFMKEFKKLKTKYVAVRSSATAEDSSVASWAGELESYLNTTEKTLLLNIKNCWSSLFTPRAIFYRKEKDLLDTHVSVAVVIQEMVESEVSGIVFTVHPVTEDRNQMIIEAGYGLGEAIVSGSITPDNYVIDKRNWRIIDTNIAEQERQIVRCSRKGIKWVSVLKTKQKKQKLSNAQVTKLAKICAGIEDHYKKPQDIEFAFKNGKFYIVQSRPITTLLEKKANKNKETKHQNIKWVNLWEHHSNVLMTELGVIIFDKNSVYKKLPGCKTDNVLYFGVNNAVIAHHDAVELEMSGQWGKDAHDDFRFMKEYIAKVDALRKRMEDFSLSLRGLDVSKTNKKVFTALVKKYLDLMQESLAYYKLCNDEFHVVVGEEILNFLKTKVKKQEANELLFDLVSENKLNTGDKYELGLYQIAKKYKNAGASKNKNKLVREKIEHEVLLLSQKYGFVGTGEGGECWTGDHIFNEVKKISKKRIDDINKFIDNKTKRQVENKNKIAKLYKKLSLPKKLQKYSEHVRELAFNKIEIRYSWYLIMHEASKLMSHIDERSEIAKGEINFYRKDEIISLLKNNKRLDKKEITKRKKAYLFIIKDGNLAFLSGKEATALYNAEVAKEDFSNALVITGISASPGKVRGRVKIVSSFGDQTKALNSVKKGEILVTGMTRPHMVPAMKRASAFVTDEGGITCHAAIIAREMEKPCIIATRISTKALKDGDIVEVDAVKGEIKIIK